MDGTAACHRSAPSPLTQSSPPPQKGHLRMPVDRFGEYYFAPDQCQHPCADHSRPCRREADGRLLGLRLCHQHEGVLIKRIDRAFYEFVWGGQHERSLFEMALGAQIGHLIQEIRERDGRLRDDREHEGHEARKRASIVYFVERDGFVKIGTTTNLKARIKSISGGSCMIEGMTVGPVTLLAAVPGDRGYEAHLHEQFARLRVAGEWFLPDDGLWAFIDGLKGRVPMEDCAA